MLLWPQDQIDAQKILEPIEPELRSIYNRAWARMENLKEKFINSRTRPAILHDLVTQEALSSFQNFSNVRVVEQYESCFFVVDQIVALRFKKGNSIGLSSNYPTDRAKSIQRGQCDLPGIDPMIFLEVIYQTDPLWTEIRDVLIVRRIGRQIAWQYPASHGAQPIPVAIPAPSQRGVGDMVKTTKKPRKADEEKSK